LSGGWHQHISSRDATTDFTQKTAVAGAQSYFVSSGGGAFLATDTVSIELYAQSAPVPEPETWALLVAGLGAVGMVRRRRSSS